MACFLLPCHIESTIHQYEASTCPWDLTDVINDITKKNYSSSNFKHLANEKVAHGSESNKKGIKVGFNRLVKKKKSYWRHCIRSNYELDNPMTRQDGLMHDNNYQ